MKRLLLATLTATLIASSTGCCLLDRLFCYTREYPVRFGGGCRNGCGPCWGLKGPVGLRDKLGAGAAYSGPATGAVTYPYYTTRGPRDFLANNPSDIGP